VAIDPISTTTPATTDVERLQRERPSRRETSEESRAALRPDQDPDRRGVRSELRGLDARAIRSVERPDSLERSRARARGVDRESDFVSISDEARQLLRLARESAASDSAQQAQSFAPAQREVAAPQPFGERFIAVRVGPTPIEDLPRPEAERRTADRLSERAFLRELERVLSLPERAQDRAADETDEPSVRLVGSGTTEADPRLRELPGRRGPPDRPDFVRSGLEAARDDAGGIERSASSARLIGSEPVRAARREREQVELELRPRLGDDELLRATSLAPQTGAARSPRGENERAAEPSGPVGPQGRTELDAAPQITQVTGVLEADSSAAIVTRFLQSVDAPDPGPEPRPREVIGERLRPV
jgi:hypothetical protein